MDKKTCIKKSIGLLWKSLKVGDLLLDNTNPEMDGYFFTVLNKKNNSFVISDASNKPSAYAMQQGPFRWSDKKQLVLDSNEKPFKYFNETLFAKKKGGEQAAALYSMLMTNTITIEKEEYYETIKKEIDKIRDIANIVFGNHDKESGKGKSMEASAILNIMLGSGNYTNKHVVFMMALRGFINSNENRLVEKIIELEEEFDRMSNFAEFGMNILLEEETMGEA